MKKIPTDAFDHYFSLGPGRSYQQVADRYGVTKRASTGAHTAAAAESFSSSPEEGLVVNPRLLS